MTIIETVKSGKPFKRPHMSYYHTYDKDFTMQTFPKKDILAYDWCILEKVEISEEELGLAIGEYNSSSTITINEIFQKLVNKGYKK